MGIEEWDARLRDESRAEYRRRVERERRADRFRTWIEAAMGLMALVGVAVLAFAWLSVE